jgi:hypothetical protein
MGQVAEMIECDIFVNPGFVIQSHGHLQSVRDHGSLCKFKSTAWPPKVFEIIVALKKSIIFIATTVVVVTQVIPVVIVTQVIPVVTASVSLASFVDPRMSPASHSPGTSLDTLLEMGTDMIIPFLPRRAMLATNATSISDLDSNRNTSGVQIEWIRRDLVDFTVVNGKLGLFLKKSVALWDRMTE